LIMVSAHLSKAFTSPILINKNPALLKPGF